MAAAKSPTERTQLLKAVEHEDEASALEQQADAKPNLQRKFVIFAVLCGSLLFALDASMVVTLAPAISSTFDSAQLAPSLITFYLTGAAATSPLFGKLSNIYGRRALLVATSVIFSLGTLGCASTPTIEVMLVWRFVSGVGGSGLLAVGQVVLSDLVSQRQRGQYQALTNVVFTLGAVTGAPLGGLLTDTLGWRFAFYVQTPLNLLVILIYIRAGDIPLPFFEADLTKWQRLKRIDWLGSVCVILSVFATIAGLQMGGNTFAWSDWPVPVMLTAGVLLFGVFLFVEARVASQPIIAFDVLFSRTVATTAVANFCQAFALFGTILQLPWFFLAVLGLRASEAGVRYLFQSMGLAIGSVVTGQLINLTGRYQPLLFFSAMLQTVTPSLIAWTWIPNIDKWQVNDWRYFVELIFGGLGNGGCLTALLVATVASVNHAQMAIATSINAFSRALAQVLAVSLSTAWVQEHIRQRLTRELAGRSDAAELIDRIRRDIASINHLPPDVRELAVSSYSAALQSLFIFMVGVSVLGMLACAAVPQHTLSKQAPAAKDDDDVSPSRNAG